MRSTAYWLTLGLIFSVPLENAINLPGIGRGSRVVGFAAALVWTLVVLQRSRMRRPDAFHKAVFAMLIWIGLTLYWSMDPRSTISGFVTFAQIFITLLIIWDLFRTEQAVEAGLQAYVLGAVVLSVATIVNFVTAAPSEYPGFLRIDALGFQTDGIAVFLAIAAPAAWYLATGPSLRNTSKRWRIINFAFLPLGLFALILTGTRGGVVASLPTALFILWSLRHASVAQRWIAVGSLLLATAAVLRYAPAGPLERISTAVGELGGGGSLSGRREIWDQSFQAIIERPIAGSGFDAHQAAIELGKEAHNTAISVLVETGLIGFVLFGRVVMIVLLRAWQRAGWAFAFWTTQLAVIAIGAMSLSLEDYKSVWFMFALCVGSAAAVHAGHGPPEPSANVLKPAWRTPPRRLEPNDVLRQ